MTGARKRGRPVVEDKRRLRGVRANDAEWAEIKARADADGFGVAEYVRRAALGLSRFHDAAAALLVNAEMAPDPRMGGMTDCYLVPLDDIEMLRQNLET